MCTSLCTCLMKITTAAAMLGFAFTHSVSDSGSASVYLASLTLNLRLALCRTLSSISVYDCSKAPRNSSRPTVRPTNTWAALLHSAVVPKRAAAETASSTSVLSFSAAAVETIRSGVMFVAQLQRCRKLILEGRAAHLTLIQKLAGPVQCSCNVNIQRL